MDLSPIGEAVLIAREGRRLTAYRDSKGVWTIGVGHTGAAGPPVVRAGLSLTAAECDALFARDVERFVRSVREALPKESASWPGLPQHAFDALVSFCFNVGPGAFLRSGVLRRLRAGAGPDDLAGAAEAILLWSRPPEVIPRRQAEYDQFRTPYETALPRARRGDAHPIPPPVPLSSGAAASPGGPPTARPKARRRPGSGRARASASPAAPVSEKPALGLAPASAGRLARLWARLRGRVRG